MDRLDEAASRLAAIVNQEDFVSKEGKSNYQVSLIAAKHMDWNVPDLFSIFYGISQDIVMPVFAFCIFIH